MRSAAWLVCGLGLLSCGCSSDCELDDDLRLFAGDTAVDCGTADATHDRSEIDQCAVDAFEAGTAFIARYQQQGEDSKLSTALAMNTAGRVKVFRWDSSPCGGGSSCSPVTDVQSCEEPAVAAESTEDPNALPITCKSLGLAQRTCG
jgi:hypothetical protein